MIKRLKKSGKCNKCGNCCKSIILKLEGEPVKTEEMFEKGKKLNRHFKKFYISGDREDGSLKFTCKHLAKTNKCGIYLIRPGICRKYPHPELNTKMKQGCGYTYV